MEISFKEPQIPDDLFKVLPDNSYDVVMKKSFVSDQTSIIVLRKRSDTQSDVPIEGNKNLQSQ